VLLFLLEPELLLLHPSLFRHFPRRKLLIGLLLLIRTQPLLFLKQSALFRHFPRRKLLTSLLFLKESGLFPGGQPLLLGNGTDLLLQVTQVGFLLKN
jgi:hypothetical protein